MLTDYPDGYLAGHPVRPQRAVLGGPARPAVAPGDPKRWLDT
ncbi:hypothetical protein [Nocardia colli]